MRFVFPDIPENPDHIRLCISLVITKAMVITGMTNSNRMFFKEINLSFPVKLRTKIRYNTGVVTPPKYSSFDQKIFCVRVKADVSKIIQNAPIPAAIINQASSLAPLTDLRCQARNATKNDTRDVVR